MARSAEDQTALAKRGANALLEPVKWWSQRDTMQTADLVAVEYRGCRLPDRPEVQPLAIFVDVIGLGAGVAAHLSELGLPIVTVNAAEQPPVQDKYNRLRDELWFTMRESFMKGECSIPDDQELIAELTLPKYSITSAGKIRVQAKEKIKRAGVASPDLADALCLTFARGAVPTFSKWRRRLEYPHPSPYDLA